MLVLAFYACSIVMTILFILNCLQIFVTANFTLTVKFTHYTNPSGLCAECHTRLNLTSPNPESIVPVCCDETALTENCTNTGNLSCDTRFRWILRAFGASLETRPASALPKEPSVFNYSPCGQISDCPFSEMSRSFEQGEMAFLGEPNPFLFNSSMPWTVRQLNKTYNIIYVHSSNAIMTLVLSKCRE